MSGSARQCVKILITDKRSAGGPWSRFLAQAAQIGLKPLPRLLAPVRPLRLAELEPIFAASGACQDGSARGVIAEAGLEVVGQWWALRKGVGEQPRGGGKLSLDATEVGEVEAFGCIGGLVFALE